MQQFALASVYPRSIAWLIRSNEWDRFEEIVKYNCAMLGGYFNVIVPLTDQDSISEEYQRFLIDYDPDLIVLAPDMMQDQQNILSIDIHPFGIIPWELVSQIATLDPWLGGSGINATVGAEIGMRFAKENFSGYAFVSVADDTMPDTSRLSLVACGDVSPYGSEHKENFLQKLFKENTDENYTKAYKHFIPFPDRFELVDMILEKYQFPLSNIRRIFDACIQLQHLPQVYRSLIGLTIPYKENILRRKLITGNTIPSLVVLVAEEFDTKEATLFWNLRAGGTYVIWVSFSALEDNLDEVATWLESDYVTMLLMTRPGTDVIFSTSNEELARLQYIVELLQSKKQKDYLLWQSKPYEDTVFYHYAKPSIIEEQVVVAGTASHFTFIPKLPQEDIMGVYTVMLRWSNFMLPFCSHSFIQDKISFETVRRFIPAETKEIVLPRFRVTRERYLGIQSMVTEPIEFNRPPPDQILEALFTDSGFPQIEQSSAAKYHTSFINCCGDLADATYYLTASPYRELLEILSDNSNKNKRGWILDNPSKRRVLHHLHLRDILGKMTPSETKNYFNTVSDELPPEAFQLLEKGLLERGFLLSCNSCSYQSWYPAERVGQTFECARCFQTQVYDANPLWLYKLPEVIFQGFADNMQVPLLSLNCLKAMSKHSFEWVPDSNVYTQSDNKKSYRNIDILCISDGKLYIGEAKSNDEIDSDQFFFYEQVCKRVSVDGIVFATSRPHWSQGTQQRIDSLKTWFRGEVLILTEKDLYSNVKKA